jgi:phospholipid/cholesterol/gamma-HCH transport system permease protein
MVPVLVIFANAIGIGAGWLAAKSSLGISNADFIYGAQYFFRPFDLYYSMIKSFAFGLAITIVPCYMGFSTKQGAEGVGRSTTAAVVSASILILFFDVALAKVLLQ